MTSDILVTGGTGTLGRLVVRGLHDAGHKVRVLSRRDHEAGDGVGYVTGDLATVSARFGADTDPLITALRGGGWDRVMVCAPAGATGPVISAVRAGATGVLTAPGNAFRPPAGAPSSQLTTREIQVLTLVADGCSNKDIGTRMTLSALTVKNHLARIGRKLGAGDRAEIVALACRAGVIE